MSAATKIAENFDSKNRCNITGLSIDAIAALLPSGPPACGGFQACQEPSKRKGFHSVLQYLGLVRVSVCYILVFVQIEIENVGRLTRPRRANKRKPHRRFHLALVKPLPKRLMPTTIHRIVLTMILGVNGCNILFMDYYLYFKLFFYFEKK